MSTNINRAEQGLADKLVNSIQDVQEFQQTLKTTPQPSGADAIRTNSLATGVGSLVLAPGSTGYSTKTFTVPAGTVSAFDVLWSIRRGLTIDGTTAGDRFPDGANMTAGKRLLYFDAYVDVFNTDSDHMTLVVVVANYDVISHTYYPTMTVVYPYLTDVTVS